MSNIKAKKSLGQNFLQDESILNQIIESANISKEDVVVEIGPGKGVLTDKLAKACKKVIAIELDDRLIPILEERFKEKNNIAIIHDDILKLNLPLLIEQHVVLAGAYKVVANIPYYITAPIIRLFLETNYPPSEMILMVQKEVAERIVARPGEMSILAVAVQYYADAQYLLTVPREAFDPMPKVNSAVVKITRNLPIQKENLGPKMQDTEETRRLFRIVRAGFSAKRKTLANTISSSLHLDKKVVEDTLESLGFSKNTRAQELGVSDWKKLSGIL